MANKSTKEGLRSLKFNQMIWKWSCTKLWTFVSGKHNVKCKRLPYHTDMDGKLVCDQMVNFSQKVTIQTIQYNII